MEKMTRTAHPTPGQMMRDWRRTEGERLGRGRALTQEQAAQRIGVARSLIAGIEQGTYVPRNERVLQALYRVVGIEPSRFHSWLSAA